MFASSHVSFCQEGKGVVDACDLGGLADLPLVGFLRSVNNCLPHFFCEALVGARGVCQLAADPFLCYSFVSVDPVIYVPRAVRQSLV